LVETIANMRLFHNCKES